MIKKQEQSGFSLVETLVAITILLLVIIGPLTITSSTARSTSFASEQVIAFFLAQEGLELVEKVRDDLFLEFVDDPTGPRSDPWSDFVNNNSLPVNLQHCFDTPGTGGCGLEMADNGTVADGVNCSTAGACQLHLATISNTRRSVYTYIDQGAGSGTAYTRTIYIEDLESSPGDPEQVRVTSVVTWRSGNISQAQTVELETYLLNTYASN